MIHLPLHTTPLSITLNRLTHCSGELSATLFYSKYGTWWCHELTRQVVLSLNGCSLGVVYSLVPLSERGLGTRLVLCTKEKKPLCGYSVQDSSHVYSVVLALSLFVWLMIDSTCRVSFRGGGICHHLVLAQPLKVFWRPYYSWDNQRADYINEGQRFPKYPP